MSLPDGYAAVHAGDAWAFSATGATEWLGETLASGTLHEWAAACPGRRELRGRGTVWSVPSPATVTGDAASRWIVRHYWRGGAVARWLGDRYLAVGRPRPLDEACAALEARARGIRTPAPVAGAVYSSGMYYRADLVTEEVPDATDLAAVLFEDVSSGLDRSASLTAAGALVRAMERAGLMHPDLNAKNVLLTAQADGPTAHLIDLDRCYARGAGVPAPALLMRSRLERSLRKFERRTRRPLSTAEWAALRAGWDTRR